MTIREAINKATIKLKTEKIDNPKLKARLLMQFILNQTRQYIMVYDEKKLTREQEEKYFKNVEKIIKGIPLQHITHQQEFMKMNFYVNKDVLIPRADTEILVEEVIQIAKKIKAKKILDKMTCYRTEEPETKAGNLVMSAGATPPVSARSKPELSLGTPISGNKSYVA